MKVKGCVTPEKLFHELLGLGLHSKVIACEFEEPKHGNVPAISSIAIFWRIAFPHGFVSGFSSANRKVEARKILRPGGAP